MTTYLRQHGLMSFISLNIPEREINLHFVNSAGLQQNAPFSILLKKFIFSWFYHTIFKVLTTQDFISKMQQNAPFCILLRKKKTPLPLLVSRGLACMHNGVSSTPHHERGLSSQLVVIGTDCTGTCKSNYHANTTTSASFSKKS
jgi:hypothetical protein